MTQNVAWEAVPPPTTEDTAEVVVVEMFLIPYAQRPEVQIPSLSVESDDYDNEAALNKA